MIRAVNTKDAPEIAEIYNYYVLNSTITFEEIPVSSEEMAGRITTSSTLPWLVYEKDNEIKGYAYATSWKNRAAYRHSVETSIYLRKDTQGKGIGHELYANLLSELRQLNIRAIIGGIALPNDASIALHEKLGYRRTALFKEVGNKFGKWVDVGYWQLILDT